MIDLPCPIGSPEVIQPSITIGSLVIQEPVIVITDLLVTATSLFAWRKLSGSKYQANKYLLLFFLTMGVGTALGGTLGHGFVGYIGPPGRLPGWILGMVALAFLERNCIIWAKPYFSGTLYRILMIYNIVSITIFSLLSILSVCFLYSGIYTGIVLVFSVTSFSIMLWNKTGKSGFKYYLFGVLSFVIASMVFALKWVPSIWFTHTDLGHIVMCITMFLFYLGSRKILSKNNEVHNQNT